MNDSFWTKVASAWSRIINPNEITKQNTFLENLPEDFGYIDDKLLSDDIDDIDDW